MFRWLVYLCATTQLVAHQFHLTTSEIHYRSTDQRLEISIQIFTHDIDLLLKNANISTSDLGADNEKSQINQYLVDYFSDNFIVSDYYWSFLGKKVEGEFVIIFLEIENFNPRKQISILNSAFMEMYNNQRNIINLYHQQNVQSATLTTAQPVFQFNL
jgi:hypothetical protein